MQRDAQRDGQRDEGATAVSVVAAVDDDSFTSADTFTNLTQFATRARKDLWQSMSKMAPPEYGQTAGTTWSESITWTTWIYSKS